MKKKRKGWISICAKCDGEREKWRIGGVTDAKLDESADRAESGAGDGEI